MADKFVELTKEGETIKVHPSVVEDHQRLGWKVVAAKAEPEAEKEDAAKAKAEAKAKKEAEAKAILEAKGNK